ncbi:UDP-glucose/GDP-mannose dehydrogenase family protein [Patescibacteria group bacterium]|nr:UDP-glucose/GDP-mannose dehydrogenase family protein [Patescibacteria group bacterium]
MKILIFGSGYVGLVTAACLAELGNDVICCDIDKGKIDQLKKGIVPFFEPGLQDLITKGMHKKKISFTVEAASAVSDREIIFIAVGTPQKENGEADLSYVRAVAEDLGKNLKNYTIIVNKSTVPVGTGRLVAEIIKKKYAGDFDIVSNPEFLSEGRALYDFMNPERIVIGSNSRHSVKKMNKLFESFSCPIVNTKIETAEMIKYASNAFLATKISFVNEIANICEKVGADISEVTYAMGLDSRIGNKFLNAGIGYGGSCFPKDVKALNHIAARNEYDFKLLKSVIRVNNDQRKLVLTKTENMLGDLKEKRICIWGLSYKPDTDDTRESAAIDIIKLFHEKGVTISTYDPKVDYDKLEKEGEFVNKIIFHKDKYKALENCHLLIIATEWDEFKQADLKKIKLNLLEANIIDGRNIFNIEIMLENGFNYLSFGR